VSENENKTNTITNFSSANTSDNKIQDGYLPKDLYDECDNRKSDLNINMNQVNHYKIILNEQTKFK
jgi:hypothetical protein